jgi:DNA sulfur modification protein DndD
MFLLELRMCNFRGFYGVQALKFAPAGSNGVTVIHGENGAGKTNLLNALFWCLTGVFTPRLSNPELLINKAARDEDKEAECYVDLSFAHEGRDFQAIRTVTGRNESRFSVYQLENDIPRAVQNPQQFVERIIPKALSRWFFFDAEAIGELELSGSEEFRRSLRRILGFELVDVLVDDLQLCLSKKQRNLANVTNSKSLVDIQEKIEGIEHVLRAQRKKLPILEAEVHTLDAKVEHIEAQLRGLPKSKPLQERRSRIEIQRKQRLMTRQELRDQEARFTGESAPAVLAIAQAIGFENQLHIKENTGRLPAPFSEQLVEDILREATCVCGRPVSHGSCEEDKIRGLLRSASTTQFNARVRSIQYLLKDIRSTHDRYEETLAGIQRKAEVTDSEIAEIDSELKEIREQLQQIDEESIRVLEDSRISTNAQYRNLLSQQGVLQNQVAENERKLSDLRLRYDIESRKLGHGDVVRREIDKIKRLSDYITKTLKEQEIRALKVLQIELDRVLRKFLTKHYKARINPKTYEVEMLDTQDRQVGRSTGEAQVLKFAFVTTVVALAGRKTQEKIDFLAEPTVAPLVLDAPFSALDPDYQGSVAKNLASQSTQLVLLLSSAAWGESVAAALEGCVKKRYMLVSREVGQRGDKPVKTMMLAGRQLTLNEYGAERDESVIEEIT